MFTSDHNSPKDSLRRCKGDPSCAQKEKTLNKTFNNECNVCVPTTVRLPTRRSCRRTDVTETADRSHRWPRMATSSSSFQREKNICLVTSRNKFFYIIFGVFCSRERCCRKILKFTQHRRHQISIRTVRGRERGDSRLDLFNVRYFLARSVNLEDAEIICRCRIGTFLCFSLPHSLRLGQADGTRRK